MGDRFNFRMDAKLRTELASLAKPTNMKIATLIKAILWRHITNQKAKVAPQEEKQSEFKYTGKFAKNLPPKEIVVEEKTGRKITKNEFVDE